MVYVAHAHDSKGLAKDQWHFVVSHWADVISISYDEITSLPEDYVVILLAPQTGYVISGEVSLADFPHPPQACYVFGSDHRHFQLDHLPRKPDFQVYIPVSGYPELYSWVACAICLYDRAVKCG